MPEINSGDTAWVLAASALVMFMTPGLAFFYGGFVRNKNVLGTIMQSFIIMGIVGVLWILIGYTLAFAPSEGGIIGNLDYIGLKGVVMEPHPSLAIPHEAFVVFQLMFAIITPALITGAFAERAKFSTFMIFMAAWSILVYAPVAHWIFGEGFLSAFSVIDVLGVFGDINALDFAGGTAIHVNAGAAALAAAVMFGKRKGYGSVRRSSGSVGLASTPAAPVPPTSRPPTPSSSRARQRLPPLFPGSSSVGRSPGKRASSAPPPAPSPGSSRLHRPRAS